MSNQSHQSRYDFTFSSELRVLRGGSWNNVPEALRVSSFVSGTIAGTRVGYVGFRLVQDIP